MIQIDPIRIIEKWGHYWYRPVAPAALTIALVVLILPRLVGASRYELLSYALLLFCIWFGWFYSRRVERCPNDRIGIGVAFRYETREDEQRVVSDFVSQFRRLLSTEHASPRPRLQVLEFPKHLAHDVIDHASARRLAEKSNCHFMVYGQVKKRRFDGKDMHALETHGLVRHGPVPSDVHKKFGKEFSQLLPRQFLVDVENDLIIFEVTADLVQSVARYILGIATLVSGVPQLALALFTSLQSDLAVDRAKYPALTEIRARLPLRIRDCMLTLARWHFEAWRASRDLDHMERVRDIAVDLLKLNPDDCEPHNLRAIAHFVIDADVDKALDHAKRARSRAYPVAKYSEAFLHAYNGDLGRASRLYRQACQECPKEVALQVEEFICWVLDNEPDRVALHYCLGIVNRYGKGDPIQAKADFEIFVEQASPAEFPEEILLAKTYLKERDRP